MRVEAGKQQTWAYGVKGGAGYFSFRNSLYVQVDPDPPSDLGENWAEAYLKPWVGFSHSTGNNNEFFGLAEWAFVRTGKNATEISGGSANSSDPDNLYVGYRRGTRETGHFEIAAGRYTYQIARGLLISDGYADGGSRGGLWSNARTAWAPSARLKYRLRGHLAEAFYLERDERPESGAETRISGVNYEWQSANQKWTLGGAYFGLQTDPMRAALDGADVLNLRAYIKPFAVPLEISAEWAREDNGPRLDSNGWYIAAAWDFPDSRWQPTLQYRYAHFDGDDPDTPANESFNPLFPGFHDWGSWWQGEIAGEYFLSNSNLKTHMLRLHMQPTADIGTGIIFFDYRLDQRGSYQGGVSSNDLAREFNWYMDWRAFKMLSFSFVLARNAPRAAVKEAFDRDKPFLYMMLYANLNIG